AAGHRSEAAGAAAGDLETVPGWDRAADDPVPGALAEKVSDRGRIAVGELGEIVRCLGHRIPRAGRTGLVRGHLPDVAGHVLVAVLQRRRRELEPLDHALGALLADLAPDVAAGHDEARDVQGAVRHLDGLSLGGLLALGRTLTTCTWCVSGVRT